VIEACLRVNPLGTGTLKLGLNGLLSLGLLQSWTPRSAWYWNTPAWSLSVEAFFYLSFPFFVPLIGRLSRRQLLGASAALWMVAMLAPTAILLTGHKVAPAPPLPLLQALLELTPLFRLPEFLIGALLGRYFLLTRDAQPRFGPALSMLGAAGCLALLSAGAATPRILFSAGLLIPCSSLLLLGLAYGRGFLATLLAWPALVFLGEISYGIYILQWPLAQLFHISSGTASLPQFVVFSAALIALAALSFKYFETPVRKAVLGRPQADAASVPAAAVGELS
jgi:peptidoglycan/LPS O-acetylase OafA/YrhL